MKNVGGKSPGRPVAVKPPEKRSYFKQTDLPLYSLQDAQRVATALVDDFGGRGGTPPDVAISLKLSPASSTWRDLAGAAMAYGLTEGGPQATHIKLSPLGQKLVAPNEEGEDIVARLEAALKPRIAMEFFEKYRRAKFPSDVIGINVLKSLGVPHERAKDALEILRANGLYAGFIREVPTGLFVNLDSTGIQGPSAASSDDPGRLTKEPEPDAPVREGGPASQAAAPSVASTPGVSPPNNRVFITHGKQRLIVDQIKDLLMFGQFIPVISAERESTAIPVPEKVFEDMRTCAAGVIHVGSEGKYFDQDGNEYTKINNNVLIEIGAAMALYGKRVILLVERGVQLPSNLEGLYRCEYDGDRLDHEPTMKLLKTFSRFR